MAKDNAESAKRELRKDKYNRATRNYTLHFDQSDNFKQHEHLAAFWVPKKITKSRKGGGGYYTSLFIFSPESLPTGEKIANISTTDFEIYVTKPYQHDFVICKEMMA
jgi:hypothetical protein